MINLSHKYLDMDCPLEDRRETKYILFRRLRAKLIGVFSKNIKDKITSCKYVVISLFITFPTLATAQNQSVNWLSFEELEQALLDEPKKVMVHFYADWCVYCKKMEQDVYTKPAIETELADNYYAVKFNVESTDTISFGGKKILNLNVGKKRLAYHQMAELLAGQDGKELTLPAVVFFNESFTIEKRVFRYIPPKELLSLLKD